jgi:hypothetical protein
MVDVLSHQSYVITSQADMFFFQTLPIDYALYYCVTYTLTIVCSVRILVAVET